jgi:hypothetical protein
LSTRNGIVDQKTPEAHAEEEAQEDAESDTLAASGRPLTATSS